MKNRPMNLVTIIKIIFLKFMAAIALISYSDISVWERGANFSRSLMIVAPIAILLTAIENWYFSNAQFMVATVVIISINIIVGVRRHIRTESFEFKVLMNKTTSMIWSVTMVYLALEVVLGVAGHGPIIDGFRITLQVSTLMYPLSKIVKNIFILSDGEHPPQWIIERIYRFQKDGDLQALFENKQLEKDKE